MYMYILLLCVRVLTRQVLQTHPDVNLANEHGNTPLHYAAFWNFIGICEVCVHSLYSYVVQ